VHQHSRNVIKDIYRIIVIKRSSFIMLTIILKTFPKNLCIFVHRVLVLNPVFSISSTGFQKSSPGFFKRESGFFSSPGFSRVRVFLESETGSESESGPGFEVCHQFRVTVLSGSIKHTHTWAYINSTHRHRTCQGVFAVCRIKISNREDARAVHTLVVKFRKLETN
jgi:hypothetical protein